MQVGILPKFLDQCKSIPVNTFVLNMVKGHHLQLRCHPSFFSNFRQFDINPAVAYHSIIQKEVDELLPKSAIQPSAGGTDFYCNVFVVPKYTDDLWPIIILKEINCYMHIPTFRMPTIRQVQQLI